MKAVLPVMAGILISATAWGQKQNIQNANNELRNKNHKEAIEYINKATEDASTKDDPKAWFVKGNIYMDMQNMPEFKAQNPYRDAAAAYMQAATLKSTYEKDNINNFLVYAAQMFYNDAVAAYNNKMYDESYNLAKKTVEIRNMEEGKRFASKKAFDTVAASALTIQAYSAYYANKYDEALPLITEMKNNPIARDANIYLMLSGIYEKQGAPDKQIAVLEEGRAAFPENLALRNEELNYYIKTGRQDILMKKLEDAVAKDPGSAVLQFNLANGYVGLANPKDANDKELPKPANYKEYIGKAEAAYMAALKAEPNNAEYNYNTGVLYYNQATEINRQMNELGTSAADDKKYKEFEVVRNDLFNKAEPFFQAAYTALEPKATSLSAEDKLTYQSALVALKEIYAKQNKLDKSSEMKKKLDASRSK